MENNDFEKETRISKKRKTKKRKKVLRTVLIAFLIFTFGVVGVGAYEFNRLQPQNYFKNLKTVGNSDSTNQSNEATGSFNVLLLGSDARPGDTASHTDSILLIHADMKTHTYNILSIPRDTRVYLSKYGYTKLTSVQYISQINNGTQQGFIDTVQAVSNLTGIPINYYAETNYGGLESMVDAIGGINMNVPFNVTLTHPWYPQNQNKVITQGAHYLNGEMVAEVVHERDSVPGTDYGRQQLQEDALVGIAKQVMNPTNITKLPALAKSLPKFLISTNLSYEDIISMALSARSDFDPANQIHYRQVDGMSETRYDNVLKADNDEIVLKPDELKSVIQQYFTN